MNTNFFNAPRPGTQFTAASMRLKGAFEISRRRPKRAPLILAIIPGKS